MKSAAQDPREGSRVVPADPRQAGGQPQQQPCRPRPVLRHGGAHRGRRVAVRRHPGGPGGG
eukprot:9038087-Alexandrium_andersonii.AAC.1